MSNAGSPAPGWYPNPTLPNTEQWWDGNAWGEQKRPVEQAPLPPPPNPPLSSKPAAGQVDTTAQKKQGSGCFGIATGVMFGIVGALLLVVGGCAALLVAGSKSADDLVSVSTTANRTAAPEDESVQESSADQATDDQGESETESGGNESDDVISCTRSDVDTIVLEVVNNSPKTSSYFLTVGYFDDAGQRLADGTSILNYLRPGERAIEEQFVFEEQGTVCEVLDVDRFAAESLAGEVAEVSECQIVSEANALGDFGGSLSATNGSPETSDYVIEVAFVDAEGIRRGSGTVFIESVRTGETAPGEIFSATDYALGHTCQVVAVTRNAS